MNSTPGRRAGPLNRSPRALLTACTLLTLAVPVEARARGLPPLPDPRPQAAPPLTGTAAGGLKFCLVGETRYWLDRAGQVRSLKYDRLTPDNRLRVRQSYDGAGHLVGLNVQWSGFAGELLNVRGAFDSRGRFVKETGFRRAGVTVPLRSFLRPLPARDRC